MARLLSRLRDFGTAGLPSYALTWSQRVCEQTENQFSNQQSQLDTINAILDDNTLTPDKKPNWIFFNQFLTGEQSSLDAEATTYGITTEKTAYDNAVSALTTYLATLTTPVAWNDLTGNTAIVGVTLRSKFNDVLVKKQALLNKMHDTARSLANTAQSTANTANTTATAAQSTATAASTLASNVNKNDKNTASATVPTNILTATDAGSSVTIGVLLHDRQYGDGTSVSLTANPSAITGLAYSTLYAVYYDDTGYSGGAQTYHATTTLKTAQPEKVNGRHYCGQITTPAPAAPPVTGGGALSPSGSGPYP